MMPNSLITQFCNAIEDWSELTNAGTYPIVFYAMIHSGGVWHVEAEGRVDDPDSPEHRGKTIKEVHGRHTLEQLQSYLIEICRETQLMEDALVCGLIKVVDYQLEGLIEGFRPGLERMRQQALEWKEIYEKPEEHAELIEFMNLEMTRKGHGSFEADDLLKMGAVLWSLMPDDPSAEAAKRKSYLAAWRRVTAPILDSNNLDGWFGDYLEKVAGDKVL